MGSWDREAATQLDSLAARANAYPVGAVPITATSTNKANAAAVGTIPAVDGQIAHLVGFDVVGAGATAALVVLVAVAGADVNPAYPYAAKAGATLANDPLFVRFPSALAAPDDTTPITVTCPALGAGGTHNVVTAYGYYLPE